MDISKTTAAGNSSVMPLGSSSTPMVTGASQPFSTVFAASNPNAQSASASSPSIVSAPSLLTTASASHAARPSVKQFMDKTGLNFSDAAQLIYGVVGSNTDTRDWSAIMASSDPATTARQATAALYQQANPPVNPVGTYMNSNDTVASSGNFAVRMLTDPQLNPDGSKKILDSGLKLVDSAGLILRDAGSSPQQIAKNAWIFGLDTAPLSTLTSAAATVSPQLEKAVQDAPSVQISSLGAITPMAKPIARPQVTAAILQQRHLNRLNAHLHNPPVTRHYAQLRGHIPS